MRYWIRRLSWLMAVCLAISSILPAGAAFAQDEVDYNQVPPLLITELVPDSTNYNNADGFEFIEIYNNTNQVLNLKDYHIIYRYPTGPADDAIWTPQVRDVELAPGQAVVLWVENAANATATVADFNANYGTELIENVNIVKLSQSGGMHNQRLRDIIIATNTGEELAVATYNYGVHDVAEDLGIFYAYPKDGTNRMVKVSAKEKPATPGTVEPELVPEKPVSLRAEAKPTVEDVTPNVQSRDQVVLQAHVSDEYMVASVTAYYRSAGQEEYKTGNLVKGADGLYAFAVPFADLIGVESLEYYLEASNGVNTAASEAAVMEVTPAQGSGETPPLLITEIVPDSTNYSGADAYEFIEVYNNTTQPIDFGEFYVLYRYPGNTADQTWFAGLDGVRIEPGKTLVLWVDNGTNAPLTVSDFNANYGVNLVEGVDIVKAPAGGGMANGSERTLVIAAKTGEEIVEAAYNRGSSDVAANRGIVYHFPIDGTNRMVKISGGVEAASPGSVDEELIPREQRFADPDAAPVIEDRTTAVEVKPGDAVELAADVQDELVVASVTLHYALNGGEWTSVNLERDEDGLFRHTVQISSDTPEGELEYYFAASNGYNDSAAAPRSIAVKIDQVPDAPVAVTPADGAVNVPAGSVELGVAVSSPNGEPMEVRFYEGKTYDLSKPSVTVRVYANTADREPPLTLVTPGERDITIAVHDGNAVTDSVTEFPYHRFEVTLDEMALMSETVEAVWTGSSLPGRKVTMYGWNVPEQRWVEIASHVADSEEPFTLRGEVKVSDYVSGQTLNVLVQDELPVREGADYTFVWMSDTQFYAEVFPELFESQVNWIVENRDALNIQYVFHSGDVVNTVNMEYQWEFADRFMGVLDEAGIPYGVLAGNHDVYLPEMDYREFYKYFGEDRVKDQPTFGGSYLNNRGHYDLVSVEGTDYLMVYMGWQPDADGIQWMNEVLAKYPDRLAILVFHQYLNEAGVRTEIGNRLFEQVVVPNPNVKLVLSGHHHGSAMKVDDIDDDGDGIADRTVYQLLGDFQDAYRGGDGYLNVMRVDVDAGKIYVDTYSTDLDMTGLFPSYEIELDLAPKMKRVATEDFAVNVYTDRLIGAVSDVDSGATASVVWDGVLADRTYSWYVVATNSEGSTVSDLWSFHTEATVPSIVQLTEEYIASGDIHGPLASMLSNMARQMQHHYERGNLEQTVHFAEKMLEAITLPPMQRYISEPAKADLEQKLNEFLSN